MTAQLTVEHNMTPPVSKKFITALLLTGLLGLGLLWHMLANPASAPVITSYGLQTISWDKQTLTLTGQTHPQQEVRLSLDKQETFVTSNAQGLYSISLEATPKSPARAVLKTGLDSTELLLARLRNTWYIYQRADSQHGWQPSAIGLNLTPPPSFFATLTQDDSGYLAVIALPIDSTAYIYANDQLQTIIKSNDQPTALLPADTTRLRADIFNARRQISERLSLNIPPADNVARYKLTDSTVWLYTDPTAQKAETDEFIPGQFLPIAVQ